MKSQMTRFALAGKCDGRGASGFSDEAVGRSGLVAAEQSLAVEQAGQADQAEPAAGTLEPAGVDVRNACAVDRPSGSAVHRGSLLMEYK